MSLYMLDITAKRISTSDMFSFTYMCKAASEAEAIEKCEKDLPDCEITYHRVEVEK